MRYECGRIQLNSEPVIHENSIYVNVLNVEYKYIYMLYTYIFIFVYVCMFV